MSMQCCFSAVWSQTEWRRWWESGRVASNDTVDDDDARERAQSYAKLCKASMNANPSWELAAVLCFVCDDAKGGIKHGFGLLPAITAEMTFMSDNITW